MIPFPFQAGGLGLVQQPSAGGGGSWVTAQSWTPDRNSSGWGGYNIRVRIQAERLLAGSKFRLTLDNTGQPISLESCYIQTRASRGDFSDFSTTPVQVTFGGNSSVVSAGGVFVSDDISLVQAATSDILISGYFNGPTTLRGRAPLTGWTNYYKAGSNESSTVDVSGYTGSTEPLMFSLVEIFQP